MVEKVTVYYARPTGSISVKTYIDPEISRVMEGGVLVLAGKDYRDLYAPGFWLNTVSTTVEEEA